MQFSDSACSCMGMCVLSLQFLGLEPTSPPYVGKQLTALHVPHAHNHCLCTEAHKLRIEASPELEAPG